MKKIVILISGRGSNMQAIIKASIQQKWQASVVCVISNRADAAGLAFAQSHHVPTEVLSHKDYADRALYDQALIDLIDAYEPDIVVLAGFMRILTADFVNHYSGRLINIHPSLLPNFKGLHTHEQAIEAGVKIHGATVHFVTAELDGGPLIAQAVVPVLPDDDADTLAQRVLQQEHVIYPLVTKWCVDEQVKLNDGKVTYADEIVQKRAYVIIGGGL